MAKKIIRSPKEILRDFEEILSLEQRAAEVYHQIAEDCDDEEIKFQLEEISQEEKGHVKIAQELVQIAQALVEKRKKGNLL